MNKPFDITIDEIKEQLNQQWDDLVEQLIPACGLKGNKFRDNYSIGNLNGDRGDSLVLWRRFKAGGWLDYATGEKGNSLQLIEKLVTGGDSKESVKWALQWLGHDDKDPVLFEKRKKSARRAAIHRDQQAEDDRQQRWANAKRIWLNSQFEWKGTPVEKYLFDRGIDLSHMFNNYFPHAIHYDPQCWDSKFKRKIPAMVTSIHIPNSGGKQAVHRTYLEQTSDGRWVKARDLENPKMTLGDYKGGYIPLWRGASGKKINKMVPDEELVITEGIEDGFVMILSDPARPVVVAVSLSNMASMILPDAVKKVILVEDKFIPKPHKSEEENAILEHRAKIAFQKACAFHLKAGRKVKRLPVPDGKGKDVNDWFTGDTQG